MAVAEEKSSLLTLDGSILEGGGQVLRNGVAFAGLLSQPLKIVNIRAGRSKPGLKPQHMTGIRLVNEIYAGDLTGDRKDSSVITFTPGGGSGLTKLSANTGTAGSVCLLIQIGLPCLLFQREACEVRLQGGTNAKNAPQFDYAEQIFLPFMKKHFGISADFECRKRGWFPRGGGIVTVKTQPVVGSLSPINIVDPGEVVEIRGLSMVSGSKLSIKAAEEMTVAATKTLKRKFRQIPYNIETTKFDRQIGNGNGLAILLYAVTSTGHRIAGSMICERNTSPSRAGELAADEVITNVQQGACLDEFLTDQVIIYMALANGKSRIRCGKPSLHTETAIHFAEEITAHVASQSGKDGGGAKFTVTKVEDHNASYIIECDGVGFVNPHIEETEETDTQDTMNDE